MNRTFIGAPADAAVLLAVGHNTNLDPTPYWDLPTLAGAGALRSSAADLSAFLAANLRGDRPYLDAHRRQADAGRPGAGIGLGWIISQRDGEEIVWHNGGTGGFRTFIGFRGARDLGVIVLSNAAESVDDIGMHLLRPSSPIEQREVAWTAQIVTLAVPLLLLVGLVRTRVATPPAAAAEQARGRRRRFHREISSRLDALVSGLYVGAVLLLFWEFGTWSGVGPTVRLAVVAATSAALLRFGWRASRLPLIAPGTPRWRIAGWVLSGALCAAIIFFSIVRA
jgi:CubicO group peptidase (beta-lactamase class C family)